MAAAAHAPACRGSAAQRHGSPSDSAYASLVERLSEPPGYFDTDNLISNEASYLHVVGEFERLSPGGGAYLGVGPDQNFSYIAASRPSIAFIVDIRRDNLLQHLLFKALFASSRDRAEYLSLLFAKPLPRDRSDLAGGGVEALVEYVDASPTTSRRADQVRNLIPAAVATFGIALSAEDRATIARIHNTFIQNGLDLRFTSFNPRSRTDYPTFRSLLLERDRASRLKNFLASEVDFQFVKALQDRNLVIPVVGDLAGDHALRAIARYLSERGEVVSAFYTSNVEFYLMRQGRFDEFVENVAALPWDARSVLIRSYFAYGSPHPQHVRGYRSVQLLQRFADFRREYASGALRTYQDLVNRHALEIR